MVKRTAGSALADRPEVKNGKSTKPVDTNEIPAASTRRSVMEIVRDLSPRPIRYRVVCKGITPLLMDPMDDETLEKMQTGAKTDLAAKKATSMKDQAAKKVYRDPNGKIALPAGNLYASLNNAGRLIQYDNKRKIATGPSSLLYTFMRIEEQWIPLSGSQEWRADRRRGVLKATGAAVPIIRPLFSDWGFEVNITVDDKAPIKIDTILKMFQDAGTASGLGSFRPECKGPFGQFQVVECEELSMG